MTATAFDTADWFRPPGMAELALAGAAGGALDRLQLRRSRHRGERDDERGRSASSSIC